MGIVAKIRHDETCSDELERGICQQEDPWNNRKLSVSPSVDGYDGNEEGVEGQLCVGKAQMGVVRHAALSCERAEGDTVLANQWPVMEKGRCSKHNALV